MKKIEVLLQQSYKSFEDGFLTLFEGDLIILSGVNGAGKSQLINIISGLDKITGQNISSKIKINDIILTRENIDFRSFKENIGINEITFSTSQSFLSAAESAWNNYINYRLNPVNQNLAQNVDSCIEAKNLLLRKFSSEDFDNGLIKESEFKNLLRNSNYIWKTGDKFTNIIGEMFFLHALKVNSKMVEVSREKFRTDMLEEAPWIKLNRLFNKLRLDYRFKSNYELSGVEINEQPRLYAIKKDDTIDENSSRNLADLSDGEKTIISLCFATLVDSGLADKKLLLLDELDSVLNPSLIQNFFTVIEEFFLQKNIAVILSTHSPSTISLSPNYTKFYEVFKPNKTGNRVLEVSPEDYTELLVANKNFYDKISDQKNRIYELEKTINSNQNILIVTEGKTDWKYFLSALRFFHDINLFTDIKEQYFYRYGSDQDFRNNVCDTKEINELSDSKLKNYLNSLVESRKIDTNNFQIRIGIFDSDTNIQLINDKERNVFSFKIEPINISTELLFSDDEIKTEIENRRLYLGDEFDTKNKIHITNSSLSLGGDNTNINKAGKRTIIECDVYNRERNNVALSKESFAQAIYKKEINISADSWSKFKSIFEQISEIISENGKYI